VFLRQVAYQDPHRCGQFFDQGRRRDDLLAFGQVRMLQQVYDLDGIGVFQMFSAILL
jgi:hypothetical protein